MACNSSSDVKRKTGSLAPSSDSVTEPGEAASILDLDERLNEMDSIVFVFYKDPHGSDSLRYTRYYREFHTTDSGLIGMVANNLKSETERLEKIKPCRSEGKIWCFSKGNIFQTIYFSAHKSTCSVVYIIKNGQFYYSALDSALALGISELKPQAREPVNAGE